MRDFSPYFRSTVGFDHPASAARASGRRQMVKADRGTEIGGEITHGFTTS